MSFNTPSERQPPEHDRSSWDDRPGKGCRCRLTHLANDNHRDTTVRHGMTDLARAVDVVFCKQKRNSTQKGIAQYSSSYVNTNTVVHA